MAVEQIYNQEDFIEIEEAIKNATVEDFQEKESIDCAKLRTKAINFINSYNKLELNKKQIKKETIKNLINNPESASYIKGLRGGQEAYILRAEYLLAFHFESIMDSFLNELPREAVYVFESQGKLISYTMTMKDLAMHVNKQGRLNISGRQLLSEEKEALENSKKNGLNEEHVRKSQAAYAGTVNRLNVYYEKANLSGGKAQGGILMWKIGKEWTLGRVLNKGDIKEAYVAALMIKHKSNLDKLSTEAIGAPQFYDEGLISTFYLNYIHDVTNKAAIVEEDVLLEDVQLGIKSAGASMPSISQYLNVAEWISTQTSMFTPEELKNYINETYSADTRRNNIVGFTNDVANEKYEELTKNLIDKNISVNMIM